MSATPLRSTRSLTTAPIRFTAPRVAGNELELIAQVLASPMWHGDGTFTRRAATWLCQLLGAPEVLLTPSGTHALELAAILLDLRPGDEVIVPSFTFTSTATAIAARGATPVFVDVEPQTLNLDVQAAADAVTDRTRAIFVVHYAGVAANVDALAELCRARGISLVEDNAHGLGARWRGMPLGTFGALAAQSFHDTKNLTCGEGGALVVNDAAFVERAEIIREKGTNRAQFLRGAVDKYTWLDHGSSYLPSEITAALLVAQQQVFSATQHRRHEVWRQYAQRLAPWAARHGVRLMDVPEGADHPAHLFYLLMPRHPDQGGLIQHLGAQEISAVFHYQPLDRSPAGLALGRTPRPCPVTADVAERIVRLPLHPGLDDRDVDRVVDAVIRYVPSS